MARCSDCRRSFHVLEDEDDGQHACPHCGYTGRRPLCDYCGKPAPDDEYAPYCSSGCAAIAEAESCEEEEG